MAYEPRPVVHENAPALYVWTFMRPDEQGHVHMYV